MFPSYLTNELEILFYIVKRAHTSLNEISSNLKISKRTVKENLIKINQEFEDTYQIQHFIVSNNNGIVCVNPAYRKSAVEYAYTLKLNLLKNNVQFNYCVQLVTHSSIDKNELIKVLYISEHYLVKITKQLNNFFKIFDIVIVSIKGIYQLTGNELSIRVFSFIFLQESFQELAWPFSKISLEEIKKSLPDELLERSYKNVRMKKRAFYILYAIFKTRTSAQNFLKMPHSKNLHSFFILINQYSHVTLFFLEHSFADIQCETRKTEILYFNFLSRIFIPYIFSEKQTKQIEKLFIESNHPYCVLSKKLFKQVAYLLTNQHDYQYVYYLSIFNAWYFLTEGNYYTFLTLYLPQPEICTPSDVAYFNRIKGTVAKLVHQETHLELLSQLLYTLSVSEKKVQVRIYLQIIKDFYASYFIKTRLSSLYNTNAISITEDFTNADIIITDSFEKATSNQDIFYLDSIENEESWHELTEFIQQKYMAKLNVGL